MEHVAIMRKSWNLIPKILNGVKKIESRWGINKSSPWGRVKKGETVYFKNSGEPVVAKASASKVLEFKNLNPQKVKKILKKYGGKNKIAFSNFHDAYVWAEHKRYCTLVFLKNPKKIDAFKINKRGYGIGSAWVSTESVSKIKLV